MSRSARFATIGTLLSMIAKCPKWVGRPIPQRIDRYAKALSTLRHDGCPVGRNE